MWQMFSQVTINDISIDILHCNALCLQPVRKMRNTIRVRTNSLDWVLQLF